MRGEVNNGKRNENKKQETELVPPRRGEDQGSLFRIKAGDMAHVPDGFEDHGSGSRHRIRFPGRRYGGRLRSCRPSRTHLVRREKHGGFGTAEVVYSAYLLRI